MPSERVFMLSIGRRSRGAQFNYFEATGEPAGYDHGQIDRNPARFPQMRFKVSFLQMPAEQRKRMGTGPNNPRPTTFLTACSVFGKNLKRRNRGRIVRMRPQAQRVVFFALGRNPHVRKSVVKTSP